MDLASILKRKSASRVKGADDLPPGWVRVESRSKPGAVFYAHPATKRTQVEKPTLKRARLPTESLAASAGGAAASSASRASRASSARHAEGPRQASRGEAAASRAQGGDVVDLDSPGEDPAEAAERRRKAAADQAEAEERARAEAFLRARERKVKEMQAARAQVEQAEREEEEPAAPVDAAPAPAPKSPGAPPRRVALAAATAGPSAAVAKKRRKNWNKEGSISEDEAVTKEDIERWRLEEEKREVEERERREEAERLRGELEAAAKAEAEAAAKAELEIVEEQAGDEEDAEKNDESACEGEDGDPCLDVMKDGTWVERHILSSSKKRWLLGRAANSVDISMQHESISRQHAALIRRGDTIYVADLGSAHGTALNGTQLEPERPVKLSAGDEVVFGASTRTYVYRDVGH